MSYKIVSIFKNEIYVASEQVPIRLVKLPLNLSEKCHKAETKDYVAYGIASISEKVLDSALKTEEDKPLKQWNLGAVILGEALKFGCSLAKNEINKNLCNPIGNN